MINKLLKFCLFFTLLILYMNTIQAGFAISLAFNPVDDLTIKKSGSLNSHVLHVSGGKNNKAISYLKFNLSSLKNNTSINSASLQLFGQNLNLRDIISVYYVNNDNWNDEQDISWEDKPVLTSLIDTEKQLDKKIHWLTWDLSSFNFTNDINDGFLSLALYAEEKTGETIFTSSEDCQEIAPKLFIDSAPIPEPSSMLLGLMALAGALGFRKRNNRVEV